MSLSAPQPLGVAHRLEAFDCGQPALTTWLRQYARQAQGSGSARTFVACDQDRVAGYYSLTVGQIDTLEAPERIRRGMGQYPIPLIILARLAVDLDYQKPGLGYSLLQDAIIRTIAVAGHAGIRALLTHPINARADAFYRRFGFEPTPLQHRQLILLLKDARRLVRP
ncbi:MULTISPECIES: GNAT family N-acetyltransferase [Thiorhodovibrio]|uniref:GNAT family N-acetyltransferase n=1 Tax=Thiorhodovibrio TaxID=61593 RepID=UPI00191166C0|nr:MULTISPECIES: GNAT family N-acetyltransferase [Thiorhodovibrio]MBK5968778.1 GNAT family N-acetyltransferase [Thiorhodovibrio winogradskyi]WPL10864.1 putative acetyltransferase [Thiorhodovibrio litoralis]